MRTIGHILEQKIERYKEKLKIPEDKRFYDIPLHGAENLNCSPIIALLAAACPVFNLCFDSYEEALKKEGIEFDGEVTERVFNHSFQYCIELLGLLNYTENVAKIMDDYYKELSIPNKETNLSVLSIDEHTTIKLSINCDRTSFKARTRALVAFDEANDTQSMRLTVEDMLLTLLHVELRL